MGGLNTPRFTVPTTRQYDNSQQLMGEITTLDLQTVSLVPVLCTQVGRIQTPWISNWQSNKEPLHDLLMTQKTDLARVSYLLEPGALVVL
jgi:hypothetical protein